MCGSRGRDPHTRVPGTIHEFLPCAERTQLRRRGTATVAGTDPLRDGQEQDRQRDERDCGGRKACRTQDRAEPRRLDRFGVRRGSLTLLTKTDRRVDLLRVALFRGCRELRQLLALLEPLGLLGDLRGHVEGHPHVVFAAHLDPGGEVRACALRLAGRHAGHLGTPEPHPEDHA